MALRDRLLRFIARLVKRQPWAIVGFGFALAVLGGGYAATSLQMNSDTNDLIAPDRPFMVKYREFIKEFGELEFIYVIVDARGDQHAAEQAVDEMTERLRVVDGLVSINSRIEPLEQLRIATRNMDAKQLREFAQVPRALQTLGVWGTDISVAQLLRAAHSGLERLVTAESGLDQAQSERLGAASVFAFRFIVSTSGGEEPLFPLPSPRYLTSGDGRYYFIRVDPRKDFSSLGAIAQPLRDMRGVIGDVQTRFPQVEIGLTGKPVLQADELATSSRDMTIASLAAFALVSIVFMVGFGGVMRPLLAVISLACGIAWTFGVATLCVGQLNLLSIVFAIILVGIGIDFGIHVVSRYLEHRQTMGVEQAIEYAILTAGRGNMTSGVTSSAAFLGAMFGDFQGLRELGFIAGIGLLLCLVAMLVLLPAMLVLVDRGRSGMLEARRLLSPSFAGSVHGFIRSHPRVILGIVLGVTAIGCAAMPRLRFEHNLLKLQAVDLDSVRWEHRLIDAQVDNVWFGAVVVNSLEDVQPMVDRASRFESFSAIHSVLDVVHEPTSVTSALRAELHVPVGPLVHASDGTEPLAAGELRHAAEQVRGLAALAALQSTDHAAMLRRLAEHVETVAGEWQDSVVARELMERALQAQFVSISAMLRGDELSLREALPDAVRNTYTSDRGRFLIMVNPVGNVWEYESMQRFVAELRLLDSDATGVPMTHFESLNEMQAAFRQAAVFAMLFVFVMLWLDFRGLRDPLLAMLPLALGLMWLIQIMAVVDLRFNLANFFAVPILIGNGVSYGVHVLHRHRERSGDRDDLGATRLAVLLTSLTTMIGFGCMMSASHRGLQSLGIVMTIGSCLCLVGAVIVLPAMLGWIDSRAARHGASRT